MMLLFTILKIELKTFNYANFTTYEQKKSTDITKLIFIDVTISCTKGLWTYKAYIYYFLVTSLAISSVQFHCFFPRKYGLIRNRMKLRF